MALVSRAIVIAFATIALRAAAPVFASESPSQRLSMLAAEAHERALDLFPFSETMGKGVGTRQDRLELTFTAEHRERQRAHNRWILAELEKIPTAALTPSERLTHELLAYRSSVGLEWLSFPFHQHYIFVQLDDGVATTLIKLAERQPLRNEADYRAWFTRVSRYPQYELPNDKGST